MKTSYLLLPCLLLAGCKGNDEQEKKPLVEVKVQRVVATEVPLTVTAPATVYGKSEARISSRITAPVRQLLVHKGQDVRKGQLLAILDNSDLRAQAADASASLAGAQASLQKTRNGTVPADVERARADVQAKSAALQLAQQVYAKRQGLFQQGAIAERELQTSKADAARAQAEYDAAKKMLDVTEHTSARSDIQIAQSNVAQSAARTQLAQANLSFTELRSPMNGTVTDQAVYPGDMAKPDVPSFAVVDLSTGIARAQIDARRSADVHVGQACSFSTQESDTTFHADTAGKITVVNQAVDPARSTIEVWCEIPNSSHALKSGLFGSVTIAVGTAHNAILLPSSAVEFEEGSQDAKVYVIDGKRVAHIRKVKAEKNSDGTVRIMSGLNAGEIVATEGEYSLPDETAVSIGGGAQ